MQYNLTFDAKSRFLAYDTEVQLTQGDTGKDILSITYTDPDGLLDGYVPYCVFGKGIKVPVENGIVNVPKGLPQTMMYIQLRFDGIDARFYSINTLQIKLKKIIG